jgi:hypothetical protein
MEKGPQEFDDSGARGGRETVTTTTHSPQHRDGGTTASWLSVTHLSDSEAGRHRQAVTDPEPEAVAPLIRRVVGALALWLAVFGVLAFERGWTSLAAVAVATGALCLLGLGVSQVIETSRSSDVGLPGPSRGVNPRRNGYSRST